MQLGSTLKSVLDTATGIIWYALEKPLEKPVPAGIFRIVSENQKISHSGDENYRTARVQLTCIANTISSLESLVESVRTALNAKTTDWEVSLPLPTRIEDKEDNLVYSIIEYYISYKK